MSLPEYLSQFLISIQIAPAFIPTDAQNNEMSAGLERRRNPDTRSNESEVVATAERQPAADQLVSGEHGNADSADSG